jgi:hypothetical protein
MGIDFGLASQVDGGQNRRKFMKEFNSASQCDQAILVSDVSDEAIESAAGSVWEKGAAVTLAFCSGLDTCPSIGD